MTDLKQAVPVPLPVLRIFTEQTSDTGGIWGFKPWAFRHVCWVPEQDYHAALERAEQAEAERDRQYQQNAELIERIAALEAQTVHDWIGGIDD
jgi:hypothetical protein